MVRMIAIVCVLVLAVSTMAYAQGPTLSIGNVSAQSGQSVNVPLNVTGFSNIGAISLKISYNSSILSYTGLANAVNGIGFTAGASNGVLTLGWFDVTGSTPLNMANGKLVDLVFSYNSGSSPLSFMTSDCEIADGQGSPISTTYSDGSVTEAAAPPLQLTIGNMQAQGGQRVEVAVNTENFENVGAISLKIQYDPVVLTFNGLTNVAKTGFNYNAAAGVATIGWFDQTGNTPLHLGNSKLLDLDFTYNGGTSQLTFLTAECEIADSVGSPLTVVYVNGSVTITGVPDAEEGTLPVKFDLLQNYPNPFNPTTVIRYELPKEAKVILKMYNLIGEEIATLVDEQQRAGRYNVTLNAGNLASGVYLYKIMAGDFVSTRKLVLAK